MKASSESGEWASLTSSAFPVAGFGGIAFRQLSLRARAACAVPPGRAGFPLAVRLAKWRTLAGEWRVGDLWPDRMFESFLSPKKPLWSQSVSLVRQVLWSRRKSRDDTRSSERSIGCGFRVCGNPLSRPEGYHKMASPRKPTKIG